MEKWIVYFSYLGEIEVEAADKDAAEEVAKDLLAEMDAEELAECLIDLDIDDIVEKEAE